MAAHFLIVNACARRLGSRAGPRTGKEERGLREKRGGRAAGVKGRGEAVGATDRRDPPRHRFAAPPSDWGGSHRGGGVASQNFARGEGLG